MMLYRSLVLGMLGAIALLVASPQRVEPAVTAVPVLMPAPEHASDVAIVDVSRRVAGPHADVLPLLGLTPGERIVDIGGIPATSADLQTRWMFTTAERFLDITIRGPRGERRILLLAHL